MSNSPDLSFESNDVSGAAEAWVAPREMTNADVADAPAVYLTTALSARVCAFLTILVLSGAGCLALLPSRPAQAELFRTSPPAPPVLPAEVGLNMQDPMLPAAVSLIFTNITSPLQAFAEEAHGPVRPYLYLLRPDHAVTGMESRLRPFPTTMMDIFDTAAARAGWSRDDRFRNEGWLLNSAGYAKDGRLFVIATLSRRISPTPGGGVAILQAPRDDWSAPGDVLPLLVLTDLPAPDRPEEAGWLSPDGWILDFNGDSGAETTIETYRSSR